MNTAKWALLTQQAAIEVTGQNIANVANPDYNRQEVQLQASYPVSTGRLTVGTGVMIKTIERKFDQFAFDQTLESNFTMERWRAREAIMDRLDIIFNETGETGLTTMMSDFFQGFYNISMNPEGATERRDLVERATTMTIQLSRMADELKKMRGSMDLKIKAGIEHINRIASQIVTLNGQIHETEMGDNKANDFRDMRDALLVDLSEYMDVTYFEQSNNEITVMFNDGRPLVVGGSAFTLDTKTNPNDPSVLDILWSDSSGGQISITDEFSGGRTSAWVELRDVDIQNYLHKLDVLAGTIVRDINRLHVSGYGLDGSTGTNFFIPLQPGGRADLANTGTGSLSAGSVLNPEIMDLDMYKITFDGAGNYSVFNEDKASASGTFSFTSGSPLAFLQQRGIQIAISGTPAAGDIFHVSGVKNAASNFSVNQAVSTNTNLLAAGQSVTGGDGRQARNIANLQHMKTIGGSYSSAGAPDGVYGASGLFTFDDFLGSVVGEVGASTLQARNSRHLAESVSGQVMNLREQISGVSLDEEMVNLIKYQHAYGAAAKMISTVDEMLQTLLQIK
jgi:flagellar hook-associated protein 1 FlgK